MGRQVTASPGLYQLLDPEVLADPYPLYRRLRSQSPVFWDPYLKVWVVTGYRDVVTVLQAFSADRALQPQQLVAMGLARMTPIAEICLRQMLFLDPPAHTRLRRLIAPAFAPRRMEMLSEQITCLAEGLLDTVAASGTMDVLADFATPLPTLVTAELLGVPAGDQSQLQRWSTDFAEVLGNFQHNPDRIGPVLRSVEEMVEYFGAIIERNPRDGLVGALLQAELAGDRLSREEVIANSIVILVGGDQTTRNLIGNGFLTLLRHPAQLRRLRREPELLSSAVEELLRYESPSQHTARIAPRDLELGGQNILKGQAVIAVMGAANRDPERFPDPDRLILDRPDNRHLAFGWSTHFCVGAPLARLEARIAFQTLLRRIQAPALVPGPLSWTQNLGLRGLKALPITFNPC